jgi:DNA-binding response OmpR family regulator
MSRKRILIVDDDAFIRRPLEFLLRRAGFETEIAADGQAALDAMERFRPDLVCMDVMMPIRDGFSTLEEMGRLGTLSRTPVILLSAKGQNKDVTRGMELGAVDFFAKPYSPTELLSRIMSVLATESVKEEVNGGQR